MTATRTLDELRNKQPPTGNSLAVHKPATMPEIMALDPKKQAIAMMEAFKDQFAVALPRHLTADRMVRLAMTAMRQNSALLACEPQSVFASVLVASQMGLEIGIDGQGYLVPYKGKATFVPGWKGYVELINRAGKAGVWTGAVFEGDRFDFSLGDSPHVHHQPTGQVDETKDNLRFVYAIGRVHDAKWPVIEVWPVAKVHRHLKKFNKVGDKHYALKDDTNFIAYARKVALMQVMKYMPKSVELRAAIAMDARGSADANIVDIAAGDWTIIAADIGESQTGETVEDLAIAQDKTAGQQAETIAREEAEQEQAQAQAAEAESHGATTQADPARTSSDAPSPLEAGAATEPEPARGGAAKKTAAKKTAPPAFDLD